MLSRMLRVMDTRMLPIKADPKLAMEMPDAQQVDRQVTRELKHKAVDYELKNTKRNNSERQ